MRRVLIANGTCERCGAVGRVWWPAPVIVDDLRIGTWAQSTAGPTLCQTCEPGLGYRRVIAGMYLETTPTHERKLHFYPYELARHRKIEPTTANLAALLVAMQQRARLAFPTLMIPGEATNL